MPGERNASVAQTLPEAVSFERMEQPHLHCPNCGQAHLHCFYEVRDIPVHSCLLMGSRPEAQRYPRGDLRLGFCRACGFITNTRFVPEVHEYGGRYEETQGFSECFNAFARELAQRLVERHDLFGKRVLEIGCGKGEFLAHLCREGQCPGIGIDPAYVPQRRPAGAEKIEFIRDFYSERYAHLQADFICCRHTLEHIAPTRRFLQTLRASIGSRMDTVVFFEVPETMRVLREGAFWDIYYEHCSYFTPGSLARLFRATGFEVTEITVEYDGQYLLLTARPSDCPTEPSSAVEDDLAEVAGAVEGFALAGAQRIAHWHDVLVRLRADRRRAVVWGAGSKAVAFLTTLGCGERIIEYAVDINPYKHGRHIPGAGLETVSPEFLRHYRPDCVIAMNPIYSAEIQRDLDRLGVRAQLLAV